MKNQSNARNRAEDENRLKVSNQTDERVRHVQSGPVTIGVNEIGIVKGTKIELESTGTQLRFEKEGDHVVMNLRVAFKSQPDNIIIEERTVNAEWVAIFDITDPDKNFCDNSDFKKLVLLTVEDGIVIGTENSDFKLFTNAPKKLSGNAFK